MSNDIFSGIVIHINSSKNITIIINYIYSSTHIDNECYLECRTYLH